MYNFTSRDLLFIPEVKFKPADGLSITAGAEFYSGKKGSLFDIVDGFMNSVYLSSELIFENNEKEEMTEFIIKYRWWIISICLVLGACFGALIPFSRTDPDIRNYVPATMSSRNETDKIENEFGVQDMVVILFSDSCILSQIIY